MCQEVGKISEQIKEIIISVADFKLEPGQIDTGDGGLIKLGLNSLSLVRMMAEIERQFDIDMEEAGAAINSIDSLSKYIIDSADQKEKKV